MEFITKDVYNQQGVLVVKKGAPVDEVLLIRLRAHGVHRLDFSEINVSSITDPVVTMIEEMKFKSDIFSMFDQLPPTMFNRAKQNAVVSRFLAEWLGYGGDELDSITVFATFFGTGIDVDLKIDPAPYRGLLEVAFTYSNMRTHEKRNVLDTLHQMQTRYLTELDVGILWTFIHRFADLLVGSVITLRDKQYRIIYVFPTDITHPLIREQNSDEITAYR